MSDVEVTDNPAENRYEARLDGELAGIAVYQLDEHRIVFLHTEVDDRFEGHGVGSTLARVALDDVRSRGGLEVVPQCRFIAGWIEKHPDYQGLVASH
jgi:uncharacterized protein